MSELTATTAQEIVRNEKDCDYMDELFGGVKMPPTQVYLKSEADKVIAELEMKLAHAQLVLRLNQPEALYSDLEIMSRLRREINVVERRECHHKYRQCLAMAEWCDAEADVADADGDYEDMRWFQKWHKRWLKIAEKFKPNNSTAQ